MPALRQYEFEESGVGCAKHGDPACLCDVTPLEGGVPIKQLPLPKVAARLFGDRNWFYDWALRVLDTLELRQQVDVDALLAAVEAYRNATSDIRIRQQQLKIITQQLTLRQAAALLQIHPHEAVRIRLQGGSKKYGPELVLEIDERLRTREQTVMEIAEAVGVPIEFVRNVARSVGVPIVYVTSAHNEDLAKKREEVRRLWSLKQSGDRSYERYSLKELSAMFGVPYTTIVSWTRTPQQRQKSADHLERRTACWALKVQGWTNERLAEKFGVSPPTISRWMTEHKRELAQLQSSELGRETFPTTTNGDSDAAVA